MPWAVGAGWAWRSHRHLVHCALTLRLGSLTPVGRYDGIFIASIFIMFRNRHGGGLVSFRSLFLLLQGLTSLYRGFFLTVQFKWHHFALMLTTYAIPIFLQFVTFSLLLLFLLRILLVMQGRSWHVKHILYPGA